MKIYIKLICAFSICIFTISCSGNLKSGMDLVESETQEREHKKTLNSMTLKYNNRKELSGIDEFTISKMNDLKYYLKFNKKLSKELTKKSIPKALISIIQECTMNPNDIVFKIPSSYINYKSLSPLENSRCWIEPTSKIFNLDFRGLYGSGSDAEAGNENINVLPKHFGDITFSNDDENQYINLYEKHRPDWLIQERKFILCNYQTQDYKIISVRSKNSNSSNRNNFKEEVIFVSGSNINSIGKKKYFFQEFTDLDSIRLVKIIPEKGLLLWKKINEENKTITLFCTDILNSKIFPKRKNNFQKEKRSSFCCWDMFR